MLCTALHILAVACLIPAFVLAVRAGFLSHTLDPVEIVEQGRRVRPRTVGVAVVGGVLGLLIVLAVIEAVAC